MAVEQEWRMVQHHLGCLGAVCYAGSVLGFITELVSLSCNGMRTVRPLMLGLHAPCEPANTFLFSSARRLGGSVLSLR